MRRFCLLRFVLLFLTLCLGIFQSSAQQKISGIVVNKTGKGIPLASVKVLETADGTSCDSTGYFSFSTTKQSPFKLLVSAIGYQEVVYTIENQAIGIKILLESTDQVIDAVEVSRRQKYNNRNPAVDLIYQVIKHKRSNRLENQPKLSFEQYDKLQFGLVNPSDRYKKGLGSMSFFFDNLDTLTIPGEKLLSIFMQEQLSNVYISNNPKAYKKKVKSLLQTDYDQRYVNNHNIQSYLSYLFQDIEIYDDNIFLINKLFLSPIANNAPVFYKYYITDTVQNEDGRFVELQFEPRNRTDLLLSGKLHISLDNRYAVRLADMQINKEANLNWVNDMHIILTYKPNADHFLYLDKSDVRIHFGVRERDAVFGRKTTKNYNYDFSPDFTNEVFQGAPLEIATSAKENKQMVTTQRPVTLSEVEKQVYANVDSLNSNRTFKSILAVGYLLAQGFHPMGAFELGPLEYLYSRNTIEGNRIRIGGRTTALFSEKVFIEGYLAYGMDDQKFKYYVKPTFALNGKSVAEFPAHYIQFGVQHDIFDPGRNLGFRKGDSFFQSIRKNRPTKWLDTYAYQVKHLIEFGNHVSLETGFTHHRRRPIGDLEFVSSGDPNVLLHDINTNDLEIVLRWAPYEKFYNRNLTRQTIIEKYPVFNVQYNRGLKGFWGGDYAYDALRASVSKRFFLNQLGFADATLAGGKIWGTLPYPLLEIPDVVKKEDRHVIDYAKMRNMEFVADSYVRFAFEHQLEGFILNKLPLIKKLKLRELWGVKMFYGQLSDANNPYIGSNVVHFDTDSDGNIMTHAMGKSPYWEGKVGLDNILSFLKVEYIRRLNYLQLPNVDKDTYRVSLNINF